MPSAVVGTIVQAVKSVAIPMTRPGSTPASARAAGHGRAQHGDVVGGHLEGPVGPEAYVGPARSAGSERSSTAWG